uniref:Uncharacterized protein n=1 Tax=Seriola lalandi dorsalis TaxID=1841481 RepID=A0A3B4X662_SERLL
MSITHKDTCSLKRCLFKILQNGSLHQKETVHDNDFEPYLTGYLLLMYATIRCAQSRT